MRYLKGDDVTFKTYGGLGNPYIHSGIVISVEHNDLVGDFYVVKTNFGNIARLTETEVD